MLDKLETLSQNLGLAFGYGTIDDLNTLADNHTDGYLLFHEGYFLANLSEDGQGALEYRHQLTLDILAPSLLSDKPADKRAHLDGLELKLRSIYKALKAYGDISGARAQTGLNLTPRNLDAIKLTLTLLPPAVSLCNS